MFVIFFYKYSEKFTHFQLSHVFCCSQSGAKRSRNSSPLLPTLLWLEKRKRERRTEGIFGGNVLKVSVPHGWLAGWLAGHCRKKRGGEGKGGNFKRKQPQNEEGKGPNAAADWERMDEKRESLRCSARLQKGKGLEKIFCVCLLLLLLIWNIKTTLLLQRKGR